MRIRLWRMGVLICCAVPMMGWSTSAIGQEAGIKLEVPETAHPGEVITVKVIPYGSLNTGNLKMMIVSSQGAEAPQFLDRFQERFSFTIRKEAIGLVAFSAMVVDEAHEELYSVEKDVRVVTDATLQSFELYPLIHGGHLIPGLKALEEQQRRRQQIELVVGRERGLTIIGKYSDGVERYLESPRTGTAYRIEHPEIVQVTDRGTIEGLKAGTTQVVASQEDFSVALDVQVFANEEEFYKDSLQPELPQEVPATNKGQGPQRLQTVIGGRGIINVINDDER